MMGKYNREIKNGYLEGKYDGWKEVRSGMKDYRGKSLLIKWIKRIIFHISPVSSIIPRQYEDTEVKREIRDELRILNKTLKKIVKK